MKTISFDADDQIDQKLEQLTALLEVARCDDFASYNDKIQNHYLWACSCLANDIKTLYQQELDQQEVRV